MRAGEEVGGRILWHCPCCGAPWAECAGCRRVTEARCDHLAVVPCACPPPLETVCGWCPAPVLIRSGRLLAGPVPDDRPLSHGICLACSARMIAKMPSPGKVIAGRMVEEAVSPPPMPWCAICEMPHGAEPRPCEPPDVDPDGDYLRP